MRLPVLVGGVVIVVVAAIVVALSTVSGPDLPGLEDGLERGPERTGKTSRGDGSGRVEPKPAREPTEEPDGPPDPDDRPRGKITGVVLDVQDRPVAGARVHARFFPSLASGPPVPGVLFTGPVVTDAAGKFAGECLILKEPREDTSLIAVLDGYVQDDGVKPEVDGPPVTIRLRRILRIMGKIIDDSTGETIEKATLLLRRASVTGEVGKDEPAMGYKVEKGSFSISDLAPGRYVLSASVPGYDRWTSEILTLSRDHPDETIEIRVARTGPWGALLLTVVGPDGTPIPKVNRALLHNSDTGFLAMTGVGVPTPVRLEAPVGRQVLQVFVDGFLRHAQLVEIPDGSEVEITARLREAGHVRFRVRDGDGKPVAGYRLAVFAPDGDELEYDLRIVTPGVDAPDEEPLEGTIGANQVIPGGDVTLKNLPPGLYRIKATREGINPVEETVSVEVSGTAEAKLTLR